MDDLKNELTAMIESHQTKVNEDQEKTKGKLSKIKEDVERSDEAIKTSIKKLKESNAEETNAMFSKILDIKNEIIDDSRRMKEKFDKIDREEDEKQEFVLDQIRRIEDKIDSQNDSTMTTAGGKSDKNIIMSSVQKVSEDSEIVKVKNELENQIQVFKLDIEKNFSKVSDVKEEFQSLKDEMSTIKADFNTFKDETSKDKDFNRDRILNFAQDINETKKLIDEKIDAYDKTKQDKFNNINSSIEDTNKKINNHDFRIKESEKIINKNSEANKKMDDKLFEVEQKYGRVARQANELSEKIETLQTAPEEGKKFINQDLLSGVLEKPLQIDESKEDKSKFEMTDLFKSFNGKKNINKLIDSKDKKEDKDQPKQSAERYGKEELIVAPIVAKNKKKALQGLEELQEYQKTHPMIEQKTSTVVIQEWVKRVKEATAMDEIENLKEEVFDEAGYDILADEEEDFFESLDGSNQPVSPQQDVFSGIQVAESGKSPKKSSGKDEDQYSDDFDENYADDFDF